MEYEAAGYVEAEIIGALFRTVPTTLAGMGAMLRYVIDCAECGDDITNTYVSVYGEAVCADTMLTTLHAAIARLLRPRTL